MERVSNAMYREWRPKHGIMMTVSLMLLVALLVAIIVSVAVKAYAQGSVVVPDQGFDAKSLFNTLIPVLWASIGPLVIALITKTVNGVSGKYVPRSVQVILSSVLGAIGAGLGDGGVTMAATAVAGGASQVYAATKPETLHTSERKP